jgi:hypothetical protein
LPLVRTSGLVAGLNVAAGHEVPIIRDMRSTDSAPDSADSCGKVHLSWHQLLFVAL